MSRGARRLALAAAVLVVALGALAAAGRLPGWLEGEGRLPVYGRLPAFTLTDQAGRPVADADLRDRVVVVNFIYTSCPDVCPALSARMASLFARLRDDAELADRVRLLSISVDPARDTPAVLADYASRFGADGETWRFLTGEPDGVRRLLVDGFKVPAQPITLPAAPPASTAAASSPVAASVPHAHDGAHPAPAAAAPAGETILHSGKVVLVDRQGRVRGYYEGLDVDLEALLGDVRKLSS